MEREEIKRRLFAADDVVVEGVPTPEWAGAGLPTFWVRSLDGSRRDRFDQKDQELRRPRDEKGNLLAADWRGMTAELVALAACTPDGEWLDFTEAEVQVLGGKNAAALDRCFAAAARLAGLGPAALDEAKKNCSPPASSPTGSS